MAKMGRPQNYHTEDIINVINQYIRYTNGKVLLNASKIAEYAQKELHLRNFKYYVINRNADSKAYVSEMNDKIRELFTTGETPIVSIYHPIDVAVISKLSGQKLIDSLNLINDYLEDVCNQNTCLIKENIKLKFSTINAEAEEKNKQLENQIEVLKKKNERIEKENDEIRLLYKKLHESVMLAWGEEAEIVLENIATLPGNKRLNNHAIITSANTNITTIDASSKRSEFIKRLEDL